jgi:hypothetical protein
MPSRWMDVIKSASFNQAGDVFPRGLPKPPTASRRLQLSAIGIICAASAANVRKGPLERKAGTWLVLETNTRLSIITYYP